jgi:hypothetical protein
MKIRISPVATTLSVLLQAPGLFSVLVAGFGNCLAAQEVKEGSDSTATDGFVWPAAVPADCPFPRSPTLTGIYFTGQHSDYQCGDTFYPSWASDGNLYSPGCTDDFDHANLSWISADQTYLARVKPSPETINDIKAYEFFAGHDSNGQPVWTSDYSKIKPLLEWNNHMGCVTATYVPGLRKYLMCVTDGWPTVAKMDSYILEADTITGPWRMVTYLKDFGEQAYFLNFPSKFISADGKSLWLCYSANFSPGWNGAELKFNPPGGRYGLCLHEVKLLGATDSKPPADNPGHGKAK